MNRQAEAILAYRAGESQYSIGRRMNVGQPTIHNWIKKAGLATIRTGHRVSHRDTVEPTEPWKPCRIIDPAVAAMFSYDIPAHELEELHL